MANSQAERGSAGLQTGRELWYEEGEVARLGEKQDEHAVLRKGTKAT